MRVRFVLATLLWLLTTLGLALVLPSAWVQKNIVDRSGYSAFAADAARDPQVQQAVAAELTTQVVALAAGNGASISPDLVRGVATGYTMSPSFPGQFAQANVIAHRWMFSGSASSDDSGRWVIDLGPMLADSSFRQTLDSFNISVPQTLSVPLTENAPAALRPGQLRPLATWGPWVSVGVTILTGVLALLTLAAAKARGKALAALGVSALLVGAAGWAGLEVGRRRVDDLLNNAPGDVRGIADGMIGHAIGNMHQWLNVTLAVGGGLVIIGVIVSLLAGLRKGG
jgi:hypothetical protein